MRTVATMQVDVVCAAGDELGEGAVWDELAGRLLHVDIERGRIYSLDPISGERRLVREFAEQVGFAIPRRGGGLVAGVGRDVILVSAEGEHERVLASVEHERPENRLNDARCDAAGRLWAGTLHGGPEIGAAALYCFDADGEVVASVPGATISNGKDWSAAGDRLYYVDTPTGRIDLFEVDPSTGALSDRRPFAVMPPGDGLPDGLAVDADDCAWVALFGGGALRRYRPDGTLDTVVSLPVSNPTSMAFGGRALEELYVTTARHGLAPKQRAAQSLAGAVLRVRPACAGRISHRFAG